MQQIIENREKSLITIKTAQGQNIVYFSNVCTQYCLSGYAYIRDTRFSIESVFDTCHVRQLSNGYYFASISYLQYNSNKFFHTDKQPWSVEW